MNVTIATLMTDAGFTIYVVTAGLVSLLLCLLAPLIGTTFGLMDDPGAKKHSLHHQNTPLVGGLAIVAPWILLSKLDPFLVQFFASGKSAGYTATYFPLFVLVFMLIGTLDDRVHLSARLRLTLMAPLFTIFVIIYPDFAIDTLASPAFGISVKLGFLAAPFTALCLLAFTNSVNMADGRNGLVIGLSMIWCITLSFYVPIQYQMILYAALASLFVTGIFNMRGRLFLGDGGTYALSVMIGLTSLYAHGIAVSGGGISSTQLATLFAIPGLDMFRLIIGRKMRGFSPMSGDHDHLHHRLDRVMGWRLGLPCYLAMAGTPVLLAFSHPKMGLVGLIFAVGLYGIAWLATRKSRQHYPSANTSDNAVTVS